MSSIRSSWLDHRTRVQTSTLAILLLVVWNVPVTVTEFAFRGQSTWTTVTKIQAASPDAVAGVWNVTVIQDSGSTLALLPSRPETTESNKEKYFLYFAQGGWANQVSCLKNAYIMATTLNRILLLAPILPHRNEPGSTKSSMVMGETEQEGFHQVRTARTSTTSPKNSKAAFNPRDLDPLYHYLERLPPDRYLPLSQVLDINATLPHVRTMDVRDFHQLFYRPTMSRATIELDYGHSHFNTMWMYNSTEILEGTRILNGFERVIRGKIQTFNLTHRDLVATLGAGSSKDVEEEELLVLLDSYRALLHPSLGDRVPWRPKMTQFIRRTVRNAVGDSRTQHINKNGWPTNYAAIHIRTGDGPFKRIVDTTIRQVLSDITPVILNWLKHNTNGTSDNDAVAPSTIGLYVATDLANFRDHKVFVIETTNLTNVVYEQYHVHLTIMSQGDVGGGLVESASGGGKTPTLSSTTNTVSSSLLHGGGMLLYADAFWDIQVCVCAPIGFKGTARSTFSHLIRLHRTANDPC